MIGIDTLAPWDKQRPLGLYNGGSAEIPAFGCYEIYDSYRPDSAEALTLDGGRTVLKVRQPTADNVANFGINGPIPLPAGQSDGFGTQDYPTYAAYDTANVPSFGEEWGPQNGSCLIKKGNKGLVIYGDQNGTIVRVARKLDATDYDIALATWTGTLSACPLTPALDLGGAAGVYPTMPSVANVQAKIANSANNAQFILGPTGTLYNPLPFEFNGTADEYWVTHWGNGNWLLRGPARKIIGGLYTTTGTSLTGGAVNWAATDGNTSPYLGSVAKVDGASPTVIEWTAKGSRTYLFTLRIQVTATSSFSVNRNSSTITTATVSGGGASVRGAQAQQIDIWMDTALGGSTITFDHVISGTMTGDFGGQFKVTITMFGATVTGVGGQLSLVAMVPRP